MSDPAIRIRVKEIERRVQDVALRMPFRFGIATLTDVPMMTMRLVAEDAMGRAAVGYSADVLPALWFDKTPSKSIDQKIEDQITMSRLGAELYLEAGSEPVTPFELWWSVYAKIKVAAAERGINPLTAGFGISFVERATIDAACRLAGARFFDAAAENLFGIEPHLVHHELAGFDVKAAIARRPLDAIWCRHTIGLGDPLRPGDVTEETRVGDGLPESLEEDVALYALRYFKIKIGADREWNRDRLGRIARVLGPLCPGGYHVTLDGNEQVEDLEDVRWLLSELELDPQTRALRRAILFIEQPLARERALSASVAPEVRKLGAECPLIIDESDSDVMALPVARDVGYLGISCKNCKGVFKAILNKCLLERWNANGEQAGRRPVPSILSSEDLTNTAIVPLQQDCATIAALGIAHSERNGHHYFKGLDHLSETERASALGAHSDLYSVRDGLAALRIEGGRMRVGSALAAVGFGYDCDIDFESRMTIDDWRARRAGAQP